MKKNIITILISALIFAVIDGLWLGLIAKSLYQNELGSLMKTDFPIIPIILFYMIFIIGLFIFVIKPMIDQQSIYKVVILSALFGLVTYSTYDLTNYITLAGFPLTIVIIDIMWGMLLTSLTSTLTYLIYRRYLK
ncbi:DUF2177 family protein [Acholeplasma granularum]|uniref:DUF2177 family protein n=1 Tax=Acholeplasma granularum TaxID=264635 RepID=UPI0004B29E84|nr:DUF2177 family protein [Acholeplasma granularum]